MSFFTWSTTANSNSTADATINWSEGQAPASVNNSARALMAAAAKYRNDSSGQTGTGGSADAYTYTSAQTFTSLQDGISITFRASATNTGASTINVDSLGAKDLQAVDGTALAAGAIVSGCIYSATYDSGDDVWLLHRSPGGQVGTSDIASDAVTQAKIADDAVGADQLASASVVVDSLASGFGEVVLQRVRDTSPNANTTTTTTPAYDTSIPQISEGEQIFSQAITPESASSVLRIHAHIYFENSAAAYVVAALFKDSDADAISSGAAYVASSTTPEEIDIYYEVSSASTSARTYSLRMGTGSGTLRINGSGGTGTLGATLTSSFLSVTEVLTV